MQVAQGQANQVMLHLDFDTLNGFNVYHYATNLCNPMSNRHLSNTTLTPNTQASSFTSLSQYTN